MSDETKEMPPNWHAFCTALGTEYRDAEEIRGSSGLVHPVVAIGVDDKGKRIVLVSSEFNPRVSAPMRGDVQATVPDMRVLVARPLAEDFAYAARRASVTEKGSLDVGKLIKIELVLQSGEEAQDAIAEVLGPEINLLFNGVKKSSLRLSRIALNVVDQFCTFD